MSLENTKKNIENLIKSRFEEVVPFVFREIGKRRPDSLLNLSKTEMQVDNASIINIKWSLGVRLEDIKPNQIESAKQKILVRTDYALLKGLGHKIVENLMKDNQSDKKFPVPKAHSLNISDNEFNEIINSIVNFIKSLPNNIEKFASDLSYYFDAHLVLSHDNAEKFRVSDNHFRRTLFSELNKRGIKLYSAPVEAISNNWLLFSGPPSNSRIFSIDSDRIVFSEESCCLSASYRASFYDYRWGRLSDFN